MTRSLRIAALAVALGLAGRAAAAVVTVTDCVGDSHLSTVSSGTHLDVGSDDLVLQCLLAPLSGTDHVIVNAHDITIQGPAGAVTGDSTQTNHITATGAFTATGTSIEQTDNNGGIEVEASGPITITNSTFAIGGSNGGGDRIFIHCADTAPVACTITVTNSTLTGHHIKVQGVGTVTFTKSKLETQSPLDEVRIESFMGDVLFGANGGGNSGDCCGMSGGGGNTVVGGNESNLYVSAFGKIDASNINVLIAELICLRSGVTNFNALGQAACAPCQDSPSSSVSLVPATIDVTDASIRNDFAKPGDIRICADEAHSTITLTGATLIDDDTSMVNDVSELNGCEQVPRTQPPCVNLIGSPATDS